MLTLWVGYWTPPPDSTERPLWGPADYSPRLVPATAKKLPGGAPRVKRVT